MICRGPSSLSIVRNLNECFVLQDFVHEFKHLDLYKRELKKLMELKMAANLRYADGFDLKEYKRSLINILDKYVDAKGVELLTTQVNITDRRQFDEAIENLGSDKSKAEAIAAQTQKTITEKMAMDPEFYDRFSKKISEILQAMHLGKLADLEALKQMKLIRDDVVNKKDESLPEKINANKGSDIFYRNLREVFGNHITDEQVYIETVLDILNIIKSEAIVDWYKNVDVKRKMINVVDDYLYDVVTKQKNIELTHDEMKTIINTVMQLAENNSEIIS